MTIESLHLAIDVRTVLHAFAFTCGVVWLIALLPRYRVNLWRKKKSTVVHFPPVGQTRAEQLHRLMKGSK